MKVSLNSEFLSEIHKENASWRWPIYETWLSREDYCQKSELGQKSSSSAPFWWSALPSKLISRYHSAAFIEWRYFSILSPEFHGICGFSLFNPEHHFPQFAEGGLILIVAGALQNAVEQLRGVAQHLHHQQRSGDEIERIQEFCFMHVFPMESVIFHGQNRQHVSAHHNGIELKIEMLDPQTADISIEMEGGLSVTLRHQALAGSPQLPTAAATDFKTVPGAHWAIFNPSPIAQVSGNIVVRPGLLQLSERSPSAHNPNFISPLLADRLCNGYVKTQLNNAPGYYEHSFGLNPMPVHGWDFLFAPSPDDRCGLVLQTYRGSSQASYLELLWQRPNSAWQTLRIPSHKCTIEWSETSWSPAMRVYVPRVRKISALFDGYKVEIENKIYAEIPFIRAHSPVVRHFFISEELSLTSWKVIDQNGCVCVDVKDVLSGGETARGRWFYNLSGLFTLSATKPF